MSDLEERVMDLVNADIRDLSAEAAKEVIDLLVFSLEALSAGIGVPDDQP